MTTFCCPHCQQLIDVYARNIGQPVLLTESLLSDDIIRRICVTRGSSEAEVIRPGHLSRPLMLIRYEIIRELHRAYPHAGDVAIARWTQVDRSTVWAVLHGEGE